MSVSRGGSATKGIQFLPSKFLLICITIARYNEQIYDHVWQFQTVNSILHADGRRGKRRGLSKQREKTDGQKESGMESQSVRVRVWGRWGCLGGGEGV